MYTSMIRAGQLGTHCDGGVYFDPVYGLAGISIWSACGQGKKKRRVVERRASKGRKLRYQVMEKLVHFMTPVQRAQPPALAAQLFANLFGQSAAAR